MTRGRRGVWHCEELRGRVIQPRDKVSFTIPAQGRRRPSKTLEGLEEYHRDSKAPSQWHSGSLFPLTCFLGKFSLSYPCMGAGGTFILHIPFAFLKGVRAVTVVTGWANNVSSQTPRAVKINETCKKVLLYIETNFFFSLQFLPISLNSEVSENRVSLCVTVFQVSEAFQESQHPCYRGTLPLVSPMTGSKPLFILFFH